MSNRDKKGFRALSPSESTKHLLQWEAAEDAKALVSPLYREASKKLLGKGANDLQALIQSLEIK